MHNSLCLSDALQRGLGDTLENVGNQVEVIEEVMNTSGRKKWVFLTWLFTWWIPSFLLLCLRPELCTACCVDVTDASMLEVLQTHDRVEDHGLLSWFLICILFLCTDMRIIGFSGLNISSY